jgi:ketosteroid isomerase-like protein
VDRKNAIDLLGRLHAAQRAFYAGGDEGAVRQVLADDIAWHVPGDNDIAGEYRGIDAVIDYFRRRRDLADRTFRMFPGDVLVGDGEHVAVLTDGAAEIDGVERRWSTVGLYRLHGDRIAECWLLPLDARAFDEIWTTSRSAS